MSTESQGVIDRMTDTVVRAIEVDHPNATHADVACTLGFIIASVLTDLPLEARKRYVGGIVYGLLACLEIETNTKH